MKLPFHLVIEYARTKPQIFEQALGDFFKDTPSLTSEQEEQAFPLFSEWVIYDFRQPSGVSFLAEYCLKNPDNLNKLEIFQMQQVVQTQKYGMFEIREVKRGEWLSLEELFSGKIYQVYDNSSSQTISEFGTLYARIGRIENKWYFVGSDPIYLSVTYTPRMKQIMQKDFSSSCCSPKDTWQLISSQDQSQAPPLLSLKEIQDKREKIKKKYQNLAEKYAIHLSFREITKLIYEEKHTPPLDVFEELVKRGFPQEVFIKNVDLLNDIWNYFPHKILKGKSPVEMYQKLKKTKKE